MSIDPFLNDISELLPYPFTNSLYFPGFFQFSPLGSPKIDFFDSILLKKINLTVRYKLL